MLTVSVSKETAAMTGLEVKRDGVIVGAGAWGVAVPVDPGAHTIEAAAPGKKPWKSTITLGADRDKQSVAIPVLEVQTSETSEPHAVTQHGLTSVQIGGLVAGGAGVVALGLGTFFGLRAIGENRDSNNSGCDGDTCSAAAKQTRLDARSAGNVSTISFVAGGTLLAGGAALYFLGASHAASQTGRIQALPAVGKNELAVLLTGEF